MSALGGTRAFASTQDALGRLPALGILELLVVYVPLAVHGGIGVLLILSRTPSTAPSPYPGPVAMAMRWTGGALAAFLVLHVFELRFRGGHASRLDGGAAASALVADLSTTSHGIPWQGFAYLVGVACVAFHFAAGVWGFFVSSARERMRPEIRRLTAWVAAAFGIAMWAILTDVVVLHATGSVLFGAGPEGPAEPCPAP
jgi:succinate dehydrogenase/fumarate reductase cytochrome b subunit